MKKIAQNIHIENSYPGVTLGLLAFPDSYLLIDAPPDPEDGLSWQAALLKMGVRHDTLLVNLDAHPDRSLGARALEYTVLAHQQTAEFFKNRPAVFKGHDPQSGAEWETIPALGNIRWLPPSITFTQHMTIYRKKYSIVIEHHPGPSPGAAWVSIPERDVVFVGDAALLNQPPFLADADLPAWIETLDLLLSKTYINQTIVSSRGGPISEKELRAQRKLLKDILKHMERLAKRQAQPTATESLIPKLLSGMKFPAKFQELYTQRLQYGLYQYYIRNHWTGALTSSNGK